MHTLLGFVLRVFLVLAGLVFAASLAAGFVVLVALWLVRSAWARLTGRPATRFVMRVDPRGGFDRMVRRPASDARTPSNLGDVTDVEPKAPRL